MSRRNDKRSRARFEQQNNNDLNDENEKRSKREAKTDHDDDETEKSEPGDLSDRVTNNSLRLSVRHAWDESTQQVAWAMDALRHHVFQCPDCHKRVILKRGTRRAAHFAHMVIQDEESCARYRSPHLSESDLHREAKLLLAEWLRRKHRIRLSRICPCCFRSKQIDVVIHDTDRVQLEFRGKDSKTDDVYIADLAIVESLGKDTDRAVTHDTVRTILEVRHTHATSDSRPEPWYEVSAEQVIRIVIPQWTAASPCMVRLEDIRDYSSFSSCGDAHCISMTQLASELGYLAYRPISDDWHQDPVAYIRHTMRGKIEQVADWRRQPGPTQSSHLWSEFLRRVKCMRCLSVSRDLKSFRPFCVSCFRLIQKRNSVPMSLETKGIDWTELRDRRRHLSSLEQLPTRASFSTWTTCWVCHLPTSRWLFYFGYRPICLTVHCLRRAVDNPDKITHLLSPTITRDDPNKRGKKQEEKETRSQAWPSQSNRNSSVSISENSSLLKPIVSPYFPIRSEHEIHRRLLQLLRRLPPGVLSFLGRSQPSMTAFVDLVE